MDTLETREDIYKLVCEFYTKVRKDELLGPIFNSHISEAQWPEHLKTLTDFWETNLLGVVKYRGNPSSKHINVDAKQNNRIEQLHFSRWINLWIETIDELFQGEISRKAKDSARKMATGQYIAIWNSRSR